MADLLSPGINVNETSIGISVPGVDSSTGAIAGLFRWGPVNVPTLVDREATLANTFGTPTDYNAETFLSAASFLAYNNSLYVSRAANTTGISAIITGASVTSGNANITVANTAALTNGMIVIASSNTSALPTDFVLNVVNSTAVAIVANTAQGTDASVTFQVVSNNAVYSAVVNTASIADLTLQTISSLDDFNNKSDNGDFDENLIAVARWPGAIGDSLKVSLCESSNQFSSNTDLTNGGVFSGTIKSVVNSNNVTIVISANSQLTSFNVNTFNTFTSELLETLSVGDNITLGNTVIGTQTTGITSISNTSNVTLNANSSTTVNVSASNTTVTATSNAFSSIVNNQFIAIYTDVDVYQTFQVANTTDANTIVLSSAPAFTNSAASWTTISNPSYTITLTTQDFYKKVQNTASSYLQRSWEFSRSFSRAPGQSTYILYNGNTAAQDEVHVIVSDEEGLFTGVPGTILEKWSGLSRATDAKTNAGDNNYYMTVVNRESQYIWLTNDVAGAASANAKYVASSTNKAPFIGSFALGQDGLDETACELSVITNAYDAFDSSDDYPNIALFITGKSRGGLDGEQIVNYIVDNTITERKLDSMVFASPQKEDVVGVPGQEMDNVVAFSNAVRDSSYIFLDSGYKYMYDKYNNVYRWVPLNGDIAGLAAQTDKTNDPWWSIAGLNRGNIKNIVKLAWNPKQTYRDVIYSYSVNPVVTFNDGTGTVLFGDKTHLSKPSNFDRINVRRLFLTLEKTISKMAKYKLFEFNDSFTRAQFRNDVTPYLTTVQGRRGVTDFIVICDSSNNTKEIIDANQFVGTIMVHPNKSINWITLNFTAVNQSVSFTEAEQGIF